MGRRTPPHSEYPISRTLIVERFRKGAPLTAVDTDTVYGGDRNGYTDYLTLEAMNSGA